nr:hypothetical protein [Achromobacter sp. UMC46]
MEQAGEQRAALDTQAAGQQAWTERARLAPAVASVAWQGLTLRVLNLAHAQALLGRIRDTDNGAYYALLDEDAAARLPGTEGQQWVFLVADDPVRAKALALPAQLPGHPELRVAGWVFTAGLAADTLRVGVAADRHTSDTGTNGETGALEADPESGTMLAVLGPARIGLLMLPAGRHAFTEGLDATAMLCRHYRCQVLVRGGLRAGCVIAAGNDVYCTDAPHVDLLATDDADPNRSRVMSRHGRSYRFHPPTHGIEDIVAPRWLRRDARGAARLAPHLADLADAQALLRPRGEVDGAYSGYPGELERAMDRLSALLRTAGPAQLSVRLGPGSANHARYSESPEGARELVRQIDHSEYVSISATQPVAGGTIALRVAHLTAPVRERHVRDARPENDDAEARMIKRALRDAIARLLAHYDPA